MTVDFADDLCNDLRWRANAHLFVTSNCSITVTEILG